VFFTFRIMVALGMLMIFIGLWSVWLRKRGTLYENRWFLYLVLWMGPSGSDRDPGGLVHHRNRPSAVGGLRADAHRRCVVQPQRDANEHHPDHVRAGVLLAVRRGVLGYMMRLVRKGPALTKAMKTAFTVAQVSNARLPVLCLLPMKAQKKVTATA
jgi:cytochrome bd ubiquinol oxidase subunit I